MADMLNIHLTIGGQKYPFTVKRSDEELYRKAERETNEMISQIKSAFQLDDKGVLAYAAVLLALDKLEQATSRNIDDDMAELTRINRLLESHLAKLK